MKRAPGLLLCPAPAALPSPPPSRPSSRRPRPRRPPPAATALIDRLALGDFEPAASNFAEALRAAAPPEKLAEIWTAVQSQMGAYKRRTGVRMEKQGPYEVAFVTTEFERSTVDFKVVVDDKGKIAGFFIVPPQKPADAAPDTTPPAPYVHKEAFHEREVTVGSGEWALPGTLTVPVGPGPFPALVLVHGSGPNDRDETVEKNKPFRDLAWGLASRGVAVLRYEKRTRQHGAQLAAVKDFTVQQETVDDALAAAELLRHTERDRSQARLRPRPQPGRHAHPPHRRARSAARGPDRAGGGHEAPGGHHPRAGRLSRRRGRQGHRRGEEPLRIPARRGRQGQGPEAGRDRHRPRRSRLLLARPPRLRSRPRPRRR